MRNFDPSLIREKFIERGRQAKEGKLITKEEYEEYSMNSYERNYLIQFMDNECICALTQRYMNNFTTPEKYPATYEETTLTMILPELLYRLKATL